MWMQTQLILGQADPDRMRPARGRIRAVMGQLSNQSGDARQLERRLDNVSGAIQRILVITLDEAAVLQSLYNVESNEGTHKLLSVPEQVHIWTTTVIEWCLMIAGRVQRLLTGRRASRLAASARAQRRIVRARRSNR
jgi:hypothetical protein